MHDDNEVENRDIGSNSRLDDRSENRNNEGKKEGGRSGYRGGASRRSAGYNRGGGGGSYKTAHAVLMDMIPERMKEVKKDLLSHLTGRITISIKGGSRYVFDSLAGTVKVISASEPVGNTDIALTEQDLLKLVSGQLNPQIGMLSNKINIGGNIDAAIYFFNLIVEDD